MSLCKILTGKTVDQLGGAKAVVSGALTMDKRTLESEIECLNDEINDGEGYENHTIVENQS